MKQEREHDRDAERRKQQEARAASAQRKALIDEVYARVYGELPVTRRFRPATLLECTFFGRSSGFQHGRALYRC